MSRYDESFPGGWPALIKRWQKRRRPITFGENEALPPLDVDLDALEEIKITDLPPETETPSLFYWRHRNLAQEFQGCSALALTNALVIVALRKREWPDHAPALFDRIWREKHASLSIELNRRWLISSMITFADHGLTEADRRVGHSLNIMFSLMKLYEAERLYSGFRPEEIFGVEDRNPVPLPLGMPPFALIDGDLDVNLIAPIKVEAKNAPTAGPLASHLLQVLNYDNGTLFRRLALMRSDKRASIAEQEALREMATYVPDPDDAPPKALD